MCECPLVEFVGVVGDHHVRKAAHRAERGFEIVTDDSREVVQASIRLLQPLLGAVDRRDVRERQRDPVLEWIESVRGDDVVHPGHPARPVHLGFELRVATLDGPSKRLQVGGRQVGRQIVTVDLVQADPERRPRLLVGPGNA